MANDTKGAGRFIVFEGLDGAGTSTQMKLLHRWLVNRNIPVELTSEPSDGPIGSVLRQVIDHRIAVDSITLALAFAADRADHLRNPQTGILSSLEKGRWVLCDRYLLSSLAYQGDPNIDFEWLLSINRFAVSPDATIFIDTPVEICVERINGRSAKSEFFHSSTKLEQALKNYRHIVTKSDFLGHLITVNGNLSEEKVFSELIGEFRIWLGNIGFCHKDEIINHDKDMNYSSLEDSDIEAGARSIQRDQLKE